ncbi:MAG: DUF58 domain-containing protein [Acidimicrobiales bacterium]
MPTRQGWSLLIAAAPALVAARLFGVFELYLLSSAVAVLVVLAVLHVRLARVAIDVERGVHPLRVHAGESTRIELAVGNPGRRRTPPLRIIDPIGRTAGPRLQLAPLAGGQRARVAYHLPTTRRGRVPVGPMQAEVIDPFGLARRRVRVAGATDVTVYPAVELVPALGTGGDQDPSGNAVRHNAIGSKGEEFFGLREYAVGDELRRIHWRSSARRGGELLVRQDERPWADRTTIVLDARASAYTPEGFERAVSSAASVVEAAHRARHTVQFCSTDGRDTGGGSGLGHTEAVMEYLAMVAPGGGSLRALLSPLGRGGQGGTLIVVTGRLTPVELAVVNGMRRRYNAVVVIVHEGPMPPAVNSSRLRLLDRTGAAGLAEAWAGAARRRPGVPA